MKTKSGLWAGKILTYILIILSFILFFRGWVTIKGITESERSQVTSTLSSFLSEAKGYLTSSSELETLQKQLDNEGFNIDAKTFIVDTIKIVQNLEDFSISPDEFRSNAAYLSKYMESLKDTFYINNIPESYFQEVKGMDIILTTIYFLTIIFFFSAFVLGFFKKNIMPVGYIVCIIAFFVFISVAAGQANDYVSTLKLSSTSSAYSDLGVGLTASAVLSLAFAVGALAVWIVTVYSASQMGTEVPSLREYLQKGFKPSVNNQPVNWGPAGNLNPSYSNPGQARGYTQGTKTCPYCGKALRSGAVFCTNCGAKLPAQEPPQQQTVFCTQCGTPNPAGTSFCMKCGAPLHH